MITIKCYTQRAQNVRIFVRDEEVEKKAWWHVERSEYVPGPARPSSTFFETDEVVAKKARQKAQIVTALSIYSTRS